MLGKNVRIEIFGTLVENCLYSGFITNRSHTDTRSVYVMTNSGSLSGMIDCTIIAIASSQNRLQTRLIAAPLTEIFYEPEIRSRLEKVSARFDKLICMYEKSCGAVVYRTTPRDGTKILLVKNHNGKCWTFPKGHVELNESETQTALREIKEETGLSVVIEPTFRQTSLYRPFGKIKKYVVFFLARANASAVSMQQSEIDYYLWASIDDAMKLCSHDNDTKILTEVRKRLMQEDQQNTEASSAVSADL